ncbi:hypothetical protein ACFP63_08690 [Oerskovia jenensis]|uniref:Capsid maturation protease n=1 Tax=Oerskovia jenensis TaxID=162169 RepID=A0ABS2LI85_9CELL|nr:hypothetical protein [Oerskovia jenensis]MBM7480128.1 hypothetical protein [Oerskovia jenensis]
MTVTLAESGLAEAAAPTHGPGRMNVQIINPGWGSSGYYSQDVLEAAARDRIFPAGTHMYVNHPTATENYERPERDLNTLAAVLAEDAHWDGGKLVAEAVVFSNWREPLTEMAEAIGVSIRAAAEVEEGEADGRKGRIITRLVEGTSVDFVTKAGRGGKILQVLESALAGVSEAKANDRREQLSMLLKDAYSAENTWVWIRDHDDTARTVWFEVETGEDAGIYQQSYDVSDDVATTLTGDRIEVRVRTEYVPVAPADVPSRPAGQTTATESQEGTMATTQIEESRLAQLETDAGRATVLESERDTARKETAEAHREVDTERAARIIAESDHDFNDLETAGLLASAPRIAESGRLDTDAFTKAVAEHAAKIAEAQGAGSVRGLGGSTTPSGAAPSVADVDESIATAFGRSVKEA